MQATKGRQMKKKGWGIDKDRKWKVKHDTQGDDLQNNAAKTQTTTIILLLS